MDAKRFFWLKLKEDFFDDETIKYIEEQENGIKYSNFYLKLCLKSIRYNGKLIRLVGETLIPYDVKSLSRLTGVDCDTVRIAMQLFAKIGLVKVLESGEIYMSQIEEMIGSETDKAALMRRMRAKKKSVEIEDGNSVTVSLPDCYTEIDIERDKEKDTDVDPKLNPENPDSTLSTELSTSNKPVRHKYGQYNNVFLSDEDMEKLKKEFPADWPERIERLSEYIESKGVSYKSHLATIRMWARKAGEKAQQRPDQEPKFTPEHIQQAKEMGITPEELLELKKRLRE